ncbi:helix-turn-helix transcriptional regulator [Clostridium botulinum]|uniref:XRE family transcriptional regulator n=2 Tax=Clostridium botulinum TaxID=1491 RepID=A0A846I299_CLOBO|nr:helix-turn-helix transcriptional regulator [Clostridium botulinum]AJD27960.1 helix-turn-helix family protein [Clostridium botulinum CDC_297]EPS52475.1 putative transcriptional regulator [Clostridium botulinum A1 str. CFSAN002368]ACQ53198.1 putative transcriptional regulator [Clostridium botulinum Ba4 str. 657]AJE12194.1 helix-turn-helix family protein [Clostridium botulinum CDC_1436]APR01402.1 helix-turn-helix family protein [Clostridium botulinum]
MNISQYELAKSLRFLNQSQLSKIENSKSGLRTEELIEISKELNTPINMFLREDEYKKLGERRIRDRINNINT